MQFGQRRDVGGLTSANSQPFPGQNYTRCKELVLSNLLQTLPEKELQSVCLGIVELLLYFGFILEANVNCNVLVASLPHEERLKE